MTSFLNDIKTDLRHISLSTQFEIKKHIKRKRLPIVSVLALLIPLLLYVVPLATGGEFASTGDAFASTILGFIIFLIMLSGALFTGDVISGEQEKRTGLLLYPTPQRQNSISIGKYLAGVIATCSAVALFYLVTIIEIIAIYGTGGISVNLFKSFLIALLYSTSVVSVVYFFSSMVKRAVLSTLLGFLSFLMIFPIATTLLQAAQVDPWFIITHSSDLISNVLGGSGSGFGGVGFTPEFYLGILVMTAYTIIFFLAGLILANRQKMEG